MKEVVLKVNQLSKRYEKKMPQRPLYQRLWRWRQRNPAPPLADTAFWALHNVSFELEKGDIMGLVGHNGAGKSTLLKILAGIVSPTSGEAAYQGTVTAILDIGTGFHPDLSGHDNIFLNSVVLGMNERQTAERYAEIVAFSGIEDFIHTPVKHYSSGMYLRLAFSIAFYTDIDILLLDEVFAVGDAAFRNKCLERIKELSRQGVTILLASHNNTQVLEFCNKCAWFDRGEIKALGSTKAVLEQYFLQVMQQEEQPDSDLPVQKAAHFPTGTTRQYQLLELRINGQQATLPVGIHFATAIEVQIKIRKFSPAADPLTVGIKIVSSEGLSVLLDSYSFRPDYDPLRVGPGDYLVTARLPGALLNNGLYRILVYSGATAVSTQEWQLPLLFRIADKPYANEMDGFTNHAVLGLESGWTVQTLNDHTLLY